MDLIEWVIANSKDILQSLEAGHVSDGEWEGEEDLVRHTGAGTACANELEVPGDISMVCSSVGVGARAAAAEGEPRRVPSPGVGLGRASPRQDAQTDSGRPVVEWREDRDLMTREAVIEPHVGSGDKVRSGELVPVSAFGTELSSVLPPGMTARKSEKSARWRVCCASAVYC